MNKLLSPGNLITIGGASLSLIGLTAYFTDATNLSVPTFFYGVPIFLIGISLKTTEVPPALRVVPASKFASERNNGPKELDKLIKDVTRWRYGQSCQLEASLRVLKLWDIEDGKRSAEKNNKFDEIFIQLARNVYKFNDERAKIKLAINNTLGSNIKEVKSYE